MLRSLKASGFKKRPTVESSTIQQWEEAGTLLTTAVSRFCDLSTRLETQCNTRSEDPSYLISRIDSSLNYFQSTLTRQLTQARVSLAKTRNRLSPSVLSLPQEILWEIFPNAVYHPTDKDPSAVVIRMEPRVEIIYRRLYSLLGVCTAWWRAGLTCRVLWSVIPIVDPDIGHLRSQTTSLSLERAGSKGLHLAVSLTRYASRRFDILAAHLSRFSSINISSNSGPSFSFLRPIRMLLEHGTPEYISSISLQNAPNQQEITYGSGQNPSEPLDTYLAGFQPQFYQLVKSLSALRLRAVALKWGRAAFSNRLVVLQLGGISLGRELGIDAFISALSSANKLRELKLITIRGVPDEVKYTRSPVANALILPHLESLYIEDLYINVFELFMKALAPGSYHLTLNLYPTFPTSHYMSEDSPFVKMDVTSYNSVCASLSSVKIDKLILSMDDSQLWSTATGLRALLKSVPRAKTIISNFYVINADILKAFRQPPLPSSWEDSRDGIFPKLEVIEFHCSTITSPLSNLRKEFKDLLASHPVRRMVLGIYDEDGEGEPLVDEDDGMIGWLKAIVPEFHLFPKQCGPPEMISTWQLWDV